MGAKNSILKKYVDNPNFKQLKHKFTADELAMLELIYSDLAARNGGTIDKETFLQFFPLTGLWGELMFEKCDKEQDGAIDFMEFLLLLSYCCKCTDEEKVKILFELYDVDHDGYLDKKDILCMLYNYPKSHLKNITEDMNVAPDKGKKMANIKKLGRIHSMAQISTRNSLSLKNAPDLAQDLASFKLKKTVSSQISGLQQLYDEEKMGSEPVKKNEVLLSIVDEDSDVGEERPSAQAINEMQRDFLNHKHIDKGIQPNLRKNPETKKTNGDHKIERSTRRFSAWPQMNCEIPKKPIQTNNMNNKLDLRPITIPVATNVNNRLKQYANYLFKSCERGNTTGMLSAEDFQNWIKAHPAMLKFFTESFHQEIWECTNENQHHHHHTPFRSASITLGMLGRAHDVSPSKRDAGSLVNLSSNKLDLRLDVRSDLPLRCYQKLPEHSGMLYRYNPKSKKMKKQLVELRGHFLFYYNHKTSKLPKGIIFLDGCYIEVKEDELINNRYGFMITHKSPLYPTHYFYCSSKTDLDTWMSHLLQFQNSSIQDFYIMGPRIGSGKFSVVSKCTSVKDKQEYAIKVINKQKLTDEEREFLLDETSIFKVLNHRNIIKHVETIENKSFLYIITELVRDGDLFDYVLRNQFLEESEAHVVMKQLLECLSYLYDAGVIHRDLKPENILIVQDPNTQKIKEIKLIDFGFAKFVTEEHKLMEACGTPNYAAPEIYIGNGYDQRADMWSAGIIMHFLLHGTLPFDADELETILERTCMEDLYLEGRFWDNVSPEAKDLLTRMLEKDPELRITVKEALQHPWIKKTKEALSGYNGKNFKCKATSALTKYKVLSPKKRMCKY